jgi:hypothetical protein
VIEINQACAVQTGCHPDDTPGFPVRIPAGASYRLTSDLVVGDGNTTAIQGFVPAGQPLQNGSATLDLGGFSIRCTATNIALCESGAGIGVDFGAITGATVRNGTVRNLGNDGVLLGDGGIVQSLHALSNGQPADITVAGIRCGQGCAISQCVATQNGRYGIMVGNGSSVLDSVARLNGGAGIRAAPGALIARNALFDNDQQGVTEAGGAGVFQNSIHNNSAFGIDTTGSTPFAYGQNALRGNNGAGPEVSASGVEVDQNFCDLDTVCP